MNATTQDWMLLIGRILVGLLFIVVGIRNIMFYAGSAAYYAKLGFPMPDATVALAIAIEFGGAAMLIAGWRIRWAGWLLVLFVVIATLMAHRFWQFDAAQYANQMNHLLKNVAIIGGLLYMIALGGGALSMDGRGGNAAKAA